MCCRHNSSSRCRYADNECDEYDCTSDGSYFFYSIIFYIFLFLFFYLLFRWIFFAHRASETIHVVDKHGLIKKKKTTKRRTKSNQLDDQEPN
jgi:hypothetical protein